MYRTRTAEPLKGWDSNRQSGDPLTIRREWGEGEGEGRIRRSDERKALSTRIRSFETLSVVRIHACIHALVSYNGFFSR